MCGAFAVRKLGKQRTVRRNSNTSMKAVLCSTQHTTMTMEEELSQKVMDCSTQKLAPKIHALQCQAEQLRNGELRAVLDAARDPKSRAIRGAFGEVDQLLCATIDAISDSTYHMRYFDPQVCEAYVDCAPPKSPRGTTGSVEKKIEKLAPKLSDLQSQAELLRSGELRQAIDETKGVRRLSSSFSEVDFLLSATIDAIRGLPLQYA